VLLFMAARKVPLWWKVINCFLMVAYTIVGLIGAVGAFYFIDKHVNTYKVFFICTCSVMWHASPVPGVSVEAWLQLAPKLD
jgi:hypothetical protein